MKDSFITKLHLRELSDDKSFYHKLYSDRRLVESLDIIDELQGHTGCVNALSWSRSGNLLASGSDDQHLNIHRYLPIDSSQQFELMTTVATGHTQNIFSVKFMPHSNDNTLVTAAGDGEVRVFDINYAGSARESSRASALASESRRRIRTRSYRTDGDTNCRVYRSHGDRVKRIVTESSPYLFLTCSEDGEVRQWDLRLPSSAYPPSRGYRYAQDRSVPPPLISYKKYSLDLNSISCSASQPHYIALGGAHLHALLHDRRMAGRDKLKERGAHLKPISQMSPEEQELMSQATQCVKKFAPQGQKMMKRSDNGHITALKISDARPDEMLVSWSGDHVYSFDLVRDPVEEEAASQHPATSRHCSERKRKRTVGGSETSLAYEATAPARQRTQHPASADHDTSLRIRYQNGQSEDIPLSNPMPLTDRQRRAQRLTRNFMRIRSSILDRTADVTSFTEVLEHSASVLAEMEEIMREWTYPLNPEPEQVYVQQNLRHDRESARRFVQAAGTLARVLGASSQTNISLAPFTSIDARRSELPLHQHERFCYDFMKAILLWLESGVGRLVEGFTRSADLPPTSKAASRLPISEDQASSESVDDALVPYLLQLASEKPIVNLEVNQFEVDETRQLFESEHAAVLAFAAAVRTPFEDLSCAAEGSERVVVQDRQVAHRFWARQVARGVLLNALEGITLVAVERAFGGLRRVDAAATAEQTHLNVLPSEPGDDSESELALQAVEAVNGRGQVTDEATAEDIRHAREADVDHYDTDFTSDNDDDPETHDDSNNDEETHGDSSDADEEDDVPNLGLPRYIYRTAFERRRLRSRVEADVPTSGPTRSYRGHCNLRTVKDVNYFGIDDEYVVSGSDDGNLFIWDRKTTELVNILEGDGEVVNVIQGHPYETMLACSGIDSTIKIFSPDARSREIARLGRGVSTDDATPYWPVRVGRRTARRHHQAQYDENGEATSEPAMDSADPADVDDYVAPTGLRSRRRMHESHRIIHQNKMEIEGSNHESDFTLPHSQLLQLLFGLSSDRTLSAVLNER